MFRTKRALLFLFFLVVTAGLVRTEAAEELVVYSARKEHLIKPLFDAYEKQTGIHIKYITDKEGPLLERLKAEGEATAADLLITVDAGNLWQAANEDLLAPVQSKTLVKNIPAHLRDPKNRWFGLSVRARTIVYHTGRVKDGELSTYEQLADPVWHGRLCLRSSKKVYNQSLIAMMIAEHGEEATEEMVEGWVQNLAVEPFSNDTAVLEAISAGQCDVGIVNTYYYGRLMKEEPGLELSLFWPNQASDGVHVNVSGAGMTKYAKNPEAAQKFLEWLSEPSAQRLFADLNLEYPVSPGIPSHPMVASWGTFKQNVINVSRAGELQRSAIELMDRAEYL